MITTGRNDACPCCSGKKYKHCCLSRSVDVPQPQAGDFTLHATLQAAMGHCEAGRLHQADSLCRQILRAQPTQPDALHLLGVMACELGEANAALDYLTRATVARPRFPEAHYHLGLIHMKHGRLDQAANHYREAITAAPDFLQAHGNLGVVLNQQGQPLQALASYLTAMAIHEAVEVKIGVAECLQRLRLNASHSHLRPILTRAITEAWRRPEDLAPAAIALMSSEPHMQAALAESGQALSAWRDDALLLGLLESATVCDVALERWLTAARAALLNSALEPDKDDGALLALRAALARQCFINEYAWNLRESEVRQLDRLLIQVNATLHNGDTPQANHLLALASYQPLHTLAHADALLAMSWPDAMHAVLRQQVEEPRLEARLRIDLPRLTDISTDISCKVRQQYEESPYPRWVRSSLFPPPVPLDERLRTQLPHARFQPLGSRDALDILVAGCGTGRHSCETASHYRGARVLAIDLSASSLGYAMRHSQALRQTHVEHAQADILQLGSLERQFDLIESVGVLHHLAEPEAGWRALLTLLRPGGLMLIGLYSELARAPVVAARQFIAHRGFPATVEGIRMCREALMSGDCPQALKPLTAFGDFFGLSACRDLLFHAQEHRTSLLDIQALLDRLRLDFVGLHVEPSVLSHFRSRFPEEGAVHDLDRWHQYEIEHPDTFISMYQFWVQKRIK